MSLNPDDVQAAPMRRFPMVWDTNTAVAAIILVAFLLLIGVRFAFRGALAIGD